MIKMNEEVMIFPKTLDEFIKEYSFIDNKEIYTNGSELIQVFRIKQWEEHKQNNWNELKKGIEDVLKTTSEKWGRNCANEFDLGCLEIEMTMNIYGEILSKIQELEQGKDE